MSQAMYRPRSLRKAAKQSGRVARFLACSLVPVGLGAAAALAQTVPPVDTIEVTAGFAQDINGIISTAIRDNSISEIDVTRGTLLDSSFIGHRGIGQLNQDVGTASNQANLVLITFGQGTGDAVLWNSVHAWQEVTGNTLFVQGGARSNTIVNSFGDSAGLVQVNQNSGALNQQLNVAAVNIGSFVGTFASAVNDAGLAGVAANNQLTYNNAGPRSDIIDGSFSGFRGVAQVTQSSGDGNAVTNATVIGVTVLNLK